ncbi:MAG TPA: SMC-Scp complex subunit ScpB [Thermoanaerobaculia bacterium]|nr:SMC-Scp complex subunit ScpB [Thermoanaerobaculia bacterium]
MDGKATTAGTEAERDEGRATAVPLVEALLFASGKPVSLEALATASELPPAAVEAALAEIGRRCDVEGRGIRLDRVAGGYRFVARNEHDVPIRRLLGMDGRTKLSMASLETLAIVAYRQPITAPEIAELRGVTSASSVRTLLDKKLITTAGRKPVVGTPFLYKTTKEFLVHFGLADLSELPKPEELEALYGIEAGGPDPSQTELFPSDEGAGGEPRAVPAPDPTGEPDAG